MSTGQAKYPTTVRDFAVRMMRKGSPQNAEVIRAVRREFGIELKASALYHWRRSNGITPPLGKNMVPVERGAHLETPLCAKFNHLLARMKPNNDGRRLGAPL